MQNLQRRLTPEGIRAQHDQDGTATLPLYRSARGTQVRVMQDIFFGAKYEQMDCELPRNLRDYSQLSGKLGITFLTLYERIIDMGEG